MAKKYYSDRKFGMEKNSYANMPQDVKHYSYPDLEAAVKDDGSYVDTQGELDASFNRAAGKIRRMIKKNK